MREIFILATIALFGSCAAALETPPKQDSSTPTEQRQPVHNNIDQDLVEDIREQSQWLKTIEEEKNRRELLEKKKDDFRMVNEAYETESKKPFEDSNWDTVLALSEYYLRKYSNPQEIDSNYFNVESIVIECLYYKDEHHLIIQFIDSSVIMTQTQKTDPARAYALRMKARALQSLGRKEEAKQTYRKVMADFANSSIGEVNKSKTELEKMERSEVEYEILRSRLEKALTDASGKTVKTALSGLGDVKFTMSVDKVRQIKPMAKFDFHGQGECTYTGSLYGCITWKESFYGHDAKVAVQFTSRKKIEQIVIFFRKVEFKNACPRFKGNVLLNLIRRYGVPEKRDNQWAWNLDGVEITYKDFCLDVDFLLYSIVTLKKTSGI